MEGNGGKGVKRKYRSKDLRDTDQEVCWDLYQNVDLIRDRAILRCVAVER
jgi:hypothetical protein